MRNRCFSENDLCELLLALAKHYAVTLQFFLIQNCTDIGYLHIIYLDAALERLAAGKHRGKRHEKEAKQPGK